jgi:D-beta-D-heptose 7-phosphate kinase/D-beta-D-heptose 1-phosphate adenosyltransferase
MAFSRTISSFKDKNILIIGDIILDRYIFGKVSRISPEAPVPVVDVVREAFLLGGAANVANNIIALGGKVTVAGVIGKDRAGNVVKGLMTDSNINTDGITTGPRP